MGNTNIVEKLKNNAVFQLSLSSKELFHSNFLCWLAEDKNCSAVFTEVLKLFGFDEQAAKTITDGLQKGEYMALREYKNFDFCICEKVKNFKHGKDDEDADEEYIPGRMLLVLENKFKSIPYEAQLQDYQKKVQGLNVEGFRNKAKAMWLENNEGKELPRWSIKEYGNERNSMEDVHTKFVLLTLAQNVCSLEIFNKDQRTELNVNGVTWNVVSYVTYANTLKNNSKKDNDFTSDLIKKYSEFVLSFHNMLHQEGVNSLPDAKNVSSRCWSILSCRKDMKSIRMDDIWQKLVANVIGIALQKRLEDTNYTTKSIKSVSEVLGSKEKMPNPNEIILSIGFSRGTALIDVKLVLNENVLFGIQIQGNAYKRLLEVVDDNYDWKTDLGNFKGMFRHGPDKWEPETCEIFDEELAPTENHVVTKYTNVPKGFGGYSGKFICQWKNIKDTATVKEVIDAVLADIEKAKKIKAAKYVAKQ